MAMPHAGGDPELLRQFIADVQGVSERRFPHGRIGPDDDGEMTFAIATDLKHRIVRIQFSKPTAWLGLDVEAAERLRDALDAKIRDLKYGSAIPK